MCGERRARKSHSVPGTIVGSGDSTGAKESACSHRVAPRASLLVGHGADVCLSLAHHFPSQKFQNEAQATYNSRSGAAMCL